MSAIPNLPPRDSRPVDTSSQLALIWFLWFQAVQAILKPGINATITTAKLTGGGANGSMTFKNGILTAQTPAT